MFRVPVFLAVYSLAGVLLAPLSGAGDDVSTQYGPAVCHSLTFVEPENKNARTWEGAVTRAVNIALPHETTLCFDAERLTVAGIWHGGFLDFSKTHHTSYKGSLCPRPGGTVTYENRTAPGWQQLGGDADGPDDADARFNGYYLHGNAVVLDYRIRDWRVLESPAAGPHGAVARTLRVEGGMQPLRLLVVGHQHQDARASLEKEAATLTSAKHAYAAKLVGETDGLKFVAQDGFLYLDIPGDRAKRLFTIWLYAGDLSGLDNFAAFARSAAAGADPAGRTRGGPRRWKKNFTTEGKLGEQEGAYALDDLPVPKRPYGSWMRLSAIDFFDDGRAAVATLPGDVWIASWDKGDISRIHWQRYATGLYEPLGLKIVDGKIYVRGRDRITRLHDLNDDGEADFYENFHAHGPIGPGYHAFIFDLNTDEEGNFWYVISGRKAPSIGEVIKLSPDGKDYEVVSTHFRHPNGMGFGGPHNWVTIADNPGGKYPSGACLVRQGQSYGHNGPRTQPFLYVLPPKVDTSSGSQCWTDPERFGPLGGTIIHTSYSTSSVSYVIAKNTSPYPSGFAVQLPFGFKSGPMRLRVSPRDGQVYIACQRGWDSNAAVDGMIHRLRYTGRDAYLVTDAKPTKTGVQLTFSCPLDAKTADFGNFFAARVDDKREEEVDIDDVELIDERTVLVRFYAEDIDPSQIIDERATEKADDGRTHFRVVAPLAITFNMKAQDGAPIKETVYCTINGF